MLQIREVTVGAPAGCDMTIPWQSGLGLGMRLGGVSVGAERWNDVWG